MEQDRAKKYMRDKSWKREKNLGVRNEDIGRGRNHTQKREKTILGGKNKENAKGETIEE